MLSCLRLRYFLGVWVSDPLTNFWSTLKSDNHLVLIRHALAPGFGDPDYFDVEDCKTQRNLSYQWSIEKDRRSFSIEWNN